MTKYQPVLPGEPSKEELVDLFNKSSPTDWLFDDETSSFALKWNTPVRLLPSEDGDGSYNLVYGYDEVENIPQVRFARHFEPQLA